ncbi:hypothetical protein BCV69DRAFT_281394 [Microstroma glucosiphilum]|uniref:AB hydrolase-1 domain-containing protein n=1 Tax=Pseudomicrostroma glucosiphilum TaxID=1684307 RepID=A0A316UC03_9BASI|nr:hypothetical protein BCV69DRAFT_281394 [Pseudomicrostroma glucosiphilum]PWN22394.1 hypothetical protein BCV69DRAFT_281394 [Pseudomicrostroma glucosiphilum]
MADEEARFDRCPVLLPLLHAPSSAPHATAPPLHRLPGGNVGPSRILLREEAGQTSAASTSSTSGVTWVSTNHIFPAAYPRSHPACTTPPCPCPSPSTSHPLPLPTQPELVKEEERRRRKGDLTEWERRKKTYTYRELEPPESEEEAERVAKELTAKAFPQLWGTIQRIVPVCDAVEEYEQDGEEENVVTLFFAHANGFHKETWAETIKTILGALPSQEGKRFRVEEIWTLDTMGSGESGPLNRGSLGELASWFDGGRDIIQFIDRYLPASVNTNGRPRGCARPAAFGPEWLPTILKPSAETFGRSSSGLSPHMKKRRIIAVGHSYSGGALSFVMGGRPEMFEGIILVDPVLVHSEIRQDWVKEGRAALDQPLATGAIVRRDIWTSEQAAFNYLLSRPFFAGWDRQVLRSYARFGTTPLPDAPSQGSTLSMSKWDEAAYFATTLMQSPFALASLRSKKFKGKLHHFTMDTNGVQGEKDTKAINDAIAEMGGAFETLAGGHLVVQEQPKMIGLKLVEAIQKMCGGGTSSSVYQPPRPRL